MNYRREIDGLRAIAVLSVILFHIDRSALPGGFAGVDIFFVISGFLITGNIANEIEGRRFSLVDFYKRRVKRIAPVLMLVIAVTLAISQILLLPEDARATAKSAVWSLLSLANVYFWLYQDTGYFAADSGELPLLHLWSLGVEEQFYLIWPLLLLALYRPRSRRLFMVCAAVFALLSFFLAARLFSTAPSFVYYMLPTRAGELLLGAIVAAAVLDGVADRVAPWQASLSGVIGIVLIAASLVLLNERQPFPGWLAIAPTLGTALVILAGQCGERRLTRLLSVRPLVWVGLVSYSAYLWHWPMFAFYRYGYGQVSIPVGAVLLIATLLLAWASYRYIEQPARGSKAPPLQIFAKYYVAPAGVLLIASLIAVYPERTGIAMSSEGYRRRLDQMMRNETPPPSSAYGACQRMRVTTEDLMDPRCVLGAPSDLPPGAVLWGDSNAVHYIGMIDVFGREAGFRFRNVEVGSCPPLLSDPAPYVLPKRLADCRASLDVIRPALEDFAVIIIAASWVVYQRSDGFLQAFYETVRTLARSNKTVIIIGRVAVIRGYDRRCREKALSYPFLRCPKTEADMPEDIAATNAQLRKFADSNPNVHYFDATDYLCPRGRCSAFRADGEPRYFDASHLTHAASLDLGAEIVAREGVPQVFAAIGQTSRARTP